MTWNVAAAKARLSELLKQARKGPQVIENRGEPVAVVVSTEEFARLTLAASEPRPGAMAQLLAFTAELRGADGLDFELPRRKRWKSRAPPFEGDD